MKKKSNFIVQGSVLAAAGILSRIIGIARRFPMEHIIGDVGNGYYSAAYEVYALLLIISCYSMPLAVSKVVSAKISKKQYKNAQKAFQCAMIFAIIAGGITFFVVEAFGDILATNFMLEPMSALALKVLGPALIIVSVMGVFRGYFQGLGTMMPTAVSQIIEQVFVMIASIAGAYFLYQQGEKVGALLHNENYAPSYGAAGASLGPVIGSLIGLIFLVFVYLAFKSQNKSLIEKDTTRKEDDYKTLFRLIILTIFPVLLSTTVYNISNVIDIRIYNDIMIKKGFDSVKAYNWGVYSGKYKVLVNVPIALANAMCSSIVPVLTGLIVHERYREIREKTGQAMRFTMLIAIPSAVGLTVLARPIITLLFRGEIDMAVNLLHIGSVSVVFYTMSTLTNGVLQGINRMRIPVRNALIALAIHIAFLYGTLQMDLGIQAVVYANILFAVIVCILNGLAIKKYIHYKQEIMQTFIIPLISSVVMGGVILLVYSLLQKAFAELNVKLASCIIVCVCLLIGVIIYFTMMILLKGVRESDLNRIPGGKIIIAIAKKCNLLR